MNRTATNSPRVLTFRAATLHEALAVVQRELGPAARVLQTREVRPRGLRQLLPGSREIEIVAVPEERPRPAPARRRSVAASAASSLAAPPASTTTPPAPAEERAAPPLAEAPPEAAPPLPPQAAPPLPPEPLPTPSACQTGSAPDAPGGSDPAPRPAPVHLERDFRANYRDNLKAQLDDLHSMVEQLCRQGAEGAPAALPAGLFELFGELLDAEWSEPSARGLIDEVRRLAEPCELEDVAALRRRATQLVERRIGVTGPLRVTPGTRRIVAMVGPTGVGKTTTIAKLAANYRLREQCRVGLITVDTYRIAAVDQLQTYAEIIDLPMEVVSSPREMRAALDRLAHLDLVLMDTAGRSPRDEVRIQELKSMLSVAEADEVHLVLSGVAGSGNLVNTARQFADVGTTALLLTKLDEATGLGQLLPLLDTCRLPLSYLTNGQKVPDDIEVAAAERLAAAILGRPAPGSTAAA